MNNELTLWEQPTIQISSPVQTVFNWDETFAETKELVREDAELTATIDDAMVKRFHGRVKIGFNLMALQAQHSKNGYGNFTTAILPDFGINERFAQRCISVARLYQNSMPTSLSASIFDLPMPMDAWNRLASSAGQTVVRQLESGEIEPTQQAIKEALEEEKAKLAEEKKRAKELEDKLEAERKALTLFREEAAFNERNKEQMHVAQVQTLKQKVKELEEKPEPEPVYQDTLETAAKVATLEQQIKELEDKPDIPPEKQQELEKLQLDLKNAQTQLDFYTTQNEALAKEINEHREAAGRSFEDATALAGRLRIRQVWQYATDEVQASLRKFHTRVPSEIDRESFENEEHTRTYQTIEILEQTAMMLKKTLLQSDSTVDADISTTAISQYQPAIPGPAIPADYDELFVQYQQYVKGFSPDEKLWWRAPNSGIMDMEMDRNLHIHYTRELLKSGDPYRIKCAIEGMKRTLGYEAIA